MANPVFPTTILFTLLAMLLVMGSLWMLLKTPLVYFFRDRPGTRRIHQRIVPRAGGLCITLVFTGLLLLWNFTASGIIPHFSPVLRDICLLVAAGMLVVGFFDDTTSFEIRNIAKFLLEIVIAADVVYLFGIRFPVLTIFGVVILKNSALLGIVSVFWMVGVANALNIIDGLDGLAGTVSCISFATVAVLAMHVHAVELAVLCMVVVGCIIGFLVHNVPPARVFLGDTGSLFLGMLLSLFLMQLVSLPKENFSLATALLIAGFPILDVAVTMGRRFFRMKLAGGGWLESLRAITVADSEHTHHRLVYRGLSHTQTTMIIALLSATFCVTAIQIHLFKGLKYTLVVFIVVVVLWFLYELNFFDRFIVYFGHVVQKKLMKQPFRVGIVDADPILHHALIRFKQRKFSFDFLSHQELRSRDAIRKLRLQAMAGPNEEFYFTTAWASDTRRFSHEMIDSVIKEWVKNPPQEADHGIRLASEQSAVPGRLRENSRPYTAMLINCRDPAELDFKISLGMRLLEEMQCAVIMVTDLLPKAAVVAKGSARDIVFVRKPFYVPVFFRELFELANQKNGKGRSNGVPSGAAFFQRIAV